MKRNLHKIIQDLEVTTIAAAVDLEALPQRVRPGAAIAKTDAEAKLKTLRGEYRDQVAPRVATIFLIGPEESQKKFAELSEAEGGTLTVDAAAIYTKMATDLEPTIGAQRQFGGTQVNHLIRSMEEIATVAGAEYLPTPRLLEVSIVKTPEDTVTMVKHLIRTQIGDDLNRLWLESRIVSEALRLKYGEKVVPVVVLGASRQEILELGKSIFSGNSIEVKLGATVEQKDIIDAFAALKERLKPKTNTQTQQQKE